MRSLAIEKYCKPQDYEILDLPVPEIKSADELLIKVHAGSINPVDVKVATGAMKTFWPVPMPLKLGHDLSGTVIAVGSDVPGHFKPGTEVYSRSPEYCSGTVSEYALSTASTTALKPSSLSHIQAAAIPLASLTALQALDAADKNIDGGLKGKKVLIPGGLSGTGSIAIQLAKNVFGASKVITTLSTAKAAKAESLLGEGVVDQIIDYTKNDMAAVIPRGSVDFMFDTMGQALASLHLIKKGGMIVSVSSLPFGSDLKDLAPNMPAIIRWTLNSIGAVSKYRARRYGVDYSCLFMRPSAADLTRLSGWIEEGKLKPVVGRVTGLENLKEIREGCEEVLSGKGGTGKFVIKIGAISHGGGA
ncbi:Reticulon-4-interacting protein [Lachnellula suecica]|uniref:Reticulon-4-interacting protein n=1 Tax=Lachnellula suecica TaxID=602035 RepID=A0A8T9C9K9_9HELO|nr:Reticulon-4-interacting protein [Lachnellula suecica]